MTPARSSPTALSYSDEQLQVEIHADEVDATAAVASAAAYVPVFQNPSSQAQELQSKARFTMKMKIRKMVTVVKIHDESDSDVDDADRNQKESVSAVKKHKIAESELNLSKNNESRFTDMVTNCAKSRKTNDAKSIKAMKKKKKNKSAVDSNSQAHKAFTDETELVLLKGITDFVAKNGNGAMSDQDTFFQYANEELDSGVIKSRLLSKARKLMKKYNRYDLKVSNGEVLRPYQEKLLYDLSKKIWRRGGKKMSMNDNVTSDVTAKLRLQRKKSDEAELVDDSLQRLVEIVDRKLGYGTYGHGLDHGLVIKGLSLMDKSKRVELVKQWEILLRDESELSLRRIELVLEQGQLALGALMASSSQ